MTVFLVMQCLLAATAYLAVARWFRYTRAAEFLVSCGIVALSEVVGIELILGSARRLTLTGVFLSVAAVFVCVLVATRRFPSSHPVFIREKWQFALRHNYSLLAVASILAGFFLVKLWINLVNAPFGWDSLNYHFTFPVEWMKSRSLAVPVTVFDDPSPSYYPLNGSLLYLWLMMPLESVFLADVGQVPFFVLGFLSVYALSRRLKLPAEYAFFAAALFTLVPNHFKQLEVAYVDVMVGALFLAACLYLVRLAERFTLKDALMFGAAAGLCVGTKSVALVYAVMLLVPFAALGIRARRVGGMLLAALAAFALGGFSYLRNFLQTGNPLYPCALKFLGRVIFPGVLDLSTVRAHMEPGKEAFATLLLHEGMGAQVSVCMLLGMASLACAVLMRRKIPRQALYWLVVCPAALYLLYRYCVPLANARYLYPALGLGMMSGMSAAAHWRLPRRLVQVLVVVCSLVAAAETASHAELVACVVVSCLAAAGFWYGHQVSRRTLGIAAGALCVAGAVVLYPAHAWYLESEYDSYVAAREYSGFWPDATAAWKWLNQNTRGENIAYAGRPVPFPLYGTRFKNNVYYVSVNGVDPAYIHSFRGSSYRWGYAFQEMHDNFAEPANYRGNQDYDVWLGNLKRRETGILFVYSLHQTDQVRFPVEDTWARRHPEIFEEVFANTTVRIYRINTYS